MAVGWIAMRLRRAGFGRRRSASLHITSASATTTPSTVALPYIFATLALRLTIFISMRSWSPGSTGRRNFAFSIPASSTSFLCPVRHLLEHQHAGHLRHGFDDQHAGHHRKVGKVPLEERLVHRHVLDADDAVRLHFHDAVHQQHRIAVRQNLAYFINVQNWHGK